MLDSRGFATSKLLDYIAATIIALCLTMAALAYFDVLTR